MLWSIHLSKPSSDISIIDLTVDVLVELYRFIVTLNDNKTIKKSTAMREELRDTLIGF